MRKRSERIVQIKVTPLHFSKAISFWSKKPRPRPELLQRYLQPDMLLFDQTKSLRTLLCVAACSHEEKWIELLGKVARESRLRPDGVIPHLGSVLLQRDASNRHPLDYALESNKPKIVSLFLELIWSKEMPPRARKPLTEPSVHNESQDLVNESQIEDEEDDNEYLGTGDKNKDTLGEKLKEMVSDLQEHEIYQRYLKHFFEEETERSSLIVELARSYPSILAEQLHRLPLDPYEPSSHAPSFRRAKQDALTADMGRMALKGHHTCSPKGHSFWKEEVGGAQDRQVNVECGIIGVPGLLANPINKDDDLFAEMSTKTQLISTQAMRAAVEYKWERFGQFYWMLELARFLAFVLLYCGGLTLILSPHSHADKDTFSAPVNFLVDIEKLTSDPMLLITAWTEYLGDILVIGAAIIWIFYLRDELRQMWYQGYSYFETVWNIMDVVFLAIVGYVLALIVITEDLSVPEQTVHHAASISLLLSLPRLLQTIRGHRFLAFTTTVVIQSFADIMPFMLVMFIIVIMTGLAFMISPEDQRFDLLTTYALLLGNFEMEAYFSTPMIVLIFFLFTFGVTIMLLNIAIGLIGDTLERVQAQKDTLVLQIRSELLLGFQSTMSIEERANPDNFPEWLHVIQREKHDEQAGESSDAWAGRVITIKAAVDSVRDEQHEQAKTLKGITDAEEKRDKDIATKLTTVEMQCSQIVSSRREADHVSSQQGQTLNAVKTAVESLQVSVADAMSKSATAPGASGGSYSGYQPSAGNITQQQLLNLNLINKKDMQEMVDELKQGLQQDLEKVKTDVQTTLKSQSVGLKSFRSSQKLSEMAEEEGTAAAAPSTSKPEKKGRGK